ncbi:X-ray radiation resistance-associated protein 1 isoform X5 [Camelus ferus]|uniref:X-ray radiation resistance-associated protein 1 isoform X5 n=2 Tax=Camelus TaxID=9836 RepID=A0A8B8TTN8_CAMFR|nr:X-ray radiation resistance-associated protein 1 isoform X5 [Camelus ferus]
MASSGVYKLDDGKPYLSNCFPAKNLLRIPVEGRGHWLVARKRSHKKKPKGVVEAPAEGQESQKISFEVGGKKVSRQESQVDTARHVLDRAFLLKHHCVEKPSDLCSINVSGLKLSKAKEKDFKYFNSVIYINASENLLPLEAFHTFPALKELELAFNSIKTVYVKYGDFKSLEFLDLSFNSLTAEAICDLGILPHLRVLLLTGNGLTSLPPSLAVTEQGRVLILSWIFNLRDKQGMCTSSHIRDSSCEVTEGKEPDAGPALPRAEIAKEDAILPVALFPSLCELIFHNNPLVAHTRGVPPLLKSFLQERLGIRLVRRKIVKAKHRILMPQKDSRKVKAQVPKVPKKPLIVHHPPVITIKSSSKEMLQSEAALTEELPTTKTISVAREMPMEGLEGLSLSHRTFVPLPPIRSDSAVYSEETSHLGDPAGRHSPDDEDTKSTESIFLTQVSGLSSSIFQKDDSEVKEKGQRPPTVPRVVKRTQKKLPSASLPSKYHGYEELLTAKPDPAFPEPKGIQKNAQALQHMLKHPLLHHSCKPRLDTLQKHYVPKEKRTQRIPIPPPRKTRAQLLDDVLIRMRDPRNITEAPLGAVLCQRKEQRLVNQKQYLEAKKLLKEFRARYRRLVHCSLRTVFRATEPPQVHPALSEGHPKFGRFLEFMDEFCQEPMASDSKG